MGKQAPDVTLFAISIAPLSDTGLELELSPGVSAAVPQIAEMVRREARRRRSQLTMHEMSIAQSVLDIAFSEMEKRAARRVQKIKIRIGEFSGVVKEALEFAFDVLTPDTPASGAGG
jgi:hypothetical protein